MDGWDEDCNGTDSCWAVDNLSQASFFWTGESEGDLTGYPIVGGGDVNGDGRPDILIGAVRNDEASLDAGKAYLLLSPITPSPITQASATWKGEKSGARAGLGLTFLSGFEGDDCAEVAIGSPSFSPSDATTDAQKGRMYVFFHHCDTIQFQTSPSLAEADWILTGENAQDLLGRTIADVGDVNGDGLTDMLTSSFQHSERGLRESGRAYLFYGSTHPRKLNAAVQTASQVIIDGSREGAWFGMDLASLGDINGDGYPDMGISAPYDDPLLSNEGAVYIFLGRSASNPFPSRMSTQDADIRLEGIHAESLYGFNIATAGDLNHDGYSDFLVGEPMVSGQFYQAGRLWLYFGGPAWARSSQARSADEGAVTLEGNADFLQLGRAFAGLGDINGDQIADFGVGLEYAGGNASTAPGQVVFFSGWLPGSEPQPGDTMHFSDAFATLWGERPGNMAGSVLSPAGDLNADGVEDVLVGAGAWGLEPFEWTGRGYALLGGRYPQSDDPAPSPSHP